MSFGKGGLSISGCWITRTGISIRNQLSHKIISRSEKATVAAPDYFEGERGQVQEFCCPPIYLSVFEGASVYGSSDLFAVGDIAISDLYMRNREEGRYNIFGGCVVKFKNRKYILISYKDFGRQTDHAILLAGWASGNYYHFTFEILSRLAYADQFEEYRDWPVLVDKEALAIGQMSDLFDRVNVWKHPVIMIENCERFFVKRMVYISHNMWMPPNFMAGAQQYSRDYLFSRSGAEHVRKAVLGQGGLSGEGKYSRIYLSRKNCRNQRLINAQEVEALFRGKGYQVIYPEELTFAEEVAIFHGADIIAGPTGAAFTNLVYCKEGAKVIAIAPASHNLYCFSNIAYIVGAEFMLLGAEIVEKNEADSEDTFRMNTDKCRRCLESMHE